MYTHQMKAWMNCDIFRRWFKNEFVPCVEKYLRKKDLPRKAILLLDNAPSHLPLDELRDGDIRTLFLPPNVTSLCQPMDQGVLLTVKRQYRRRLLTKLVTSIENDADYSLQCLKKIDILDVIMWVAEAWAEVPSLLIVRSWKILLDHRASDKWEGDEMEKDETDDNLIPLLEKIPGCDSINMEDVSEWMANDDAEDFQDLSDDEILERITIQENVDDSEEEPDEVDDAKISDSDGFSALEVALRYISQQQQVTLADIICLQKWRDIAANKRALGLKQLTLHNFFER